MAHLSATAQVLQKHIFAKARFIMELKAAVVAEQTQLNVLRRDHARLEMKATRVARDWVICRREMAPCNEARDGGTGENGVLHRSAFCVCLDSKKSANLIWCPLLTLWQYFRQRMCAASTPDSRFYCSQQP